jgi:hypothetical protein
MKHFLGDSAGCLGMKLDHICFVGSKSTIWILWEDMSVSDPSYDAAGCSCRWQRGKTVRIRRQRRPRQVRRSVDVGLTASLTIIKVILIALLFESSLLIGGPLFGGPIPGGPPGGPPCRACRLFKECGRGMPAENWLENDWYRSMSPIIHFQQLPSHPRRVAVGQKSARSKIRNGLSRPDSNGKQGV